MSDEQPRDENGRFASAGGGSGLKAWANQKDAHHGGVPKSAKDAAHDKSLRDRENHPDVKAARAEESRHWDAHLKNAGKDPAAAEHHRQKSLEAGERAQKLMAKLKAGG
jgi:hypothetical protein